MNRRALPILLAGGLAALAGVLVWKALLGNPGGRTYTAVFRNARGLLPGNDVRDDGAVAGRVTQIGLTREGFARVEFQLTARAAAPRADAAAAVEPADLLGDNYLSLTPGSSIHLLHGAIDPAHSLDAPRLDEVLDAFTPAVRDSLGVLLVEGGLALDRRGGDLAAAGAALRPTLAAAGGVLRELDTQNGSLARLASVAADTAAQLDSRRDQLGPLLDGLARTLGATAGTSGALHSDLTGLPALLGQLQGTAGSLAGLTSSAQPITRRLASTVAPLNAALEHAPAAIARLTRAGPPLSGTVAAAAKLLDRGGPTLTALERALPVLRAQAPTLAGFGGELDGAIPGIADGFLVDFPDQAAESGRQPFDAFADPRRAYWRGAAVFSCEAFGVPVAPGCLHKALANLMRQPPLSAPANPPAAQPASRPAATAPHLTLPRPPASAPASAPAPGLPATPPPVSRLLGFLLGK